MSTLNEFLDIFVNEVLSERELKPKTLRFYHQKLKYIRKHLGEIDIDDISIREISDFLRLFPACSSNQYRGFLVDIFRYAIAMGYAIINPAANTIPKRRKKERQRLCWPGFCAIYEYTKSYPELFFLQNAMLVALHTLQREQDICNLPLNYNCEYVEIIQSKTGKRIRMRLNPEAKKVFKRCYDNIVSPFLIHRLPLRISSQTRSLVNRKHITQVTPGYLSKAFKEARDACGFYDHLPPKKKPTFHEIRSLGSYLYEKQGIYPQHTLGHENRAMTEHYLNGHERWVVVEVGLRLDLAI